MSSANLLEDIASYDYELPQALIAQSPAEPRDHSRLMVLHKRSERIEHRRFFEIVDCLREDDLLVLNDTRVLHCRLRGTRSTGGAIQLLLVEELEPGFWKAFVNTRGRLKAGEWIQLENGRLDATLVQRDAGGTWTIQFDDKLDLASTLEEVGRAPLPPYIRRPRQLDEAFREYDRERYQTVFASRPGAVAAPTAGLHFTTDLLDKIRSGGIRICTITLHVGVGTFLPIRTKSISRHTMEPEFFIFPEECARAVDETRRRGGRVISVGTTCCRVLETVVRSEKLAEASGWTDLYIRPPFQFRLVDALITNFHLPRSTLLVLVSAFAGLQVVLRAYSQAIADGYRFYSYGDAMFIQD